MKRIIFSGMVLLAGFIGMINAESSCQIKLNQLRSELSIPMFKETESNRWGIEFVRNYIRSGRPCEIDGPLKSVYAILRSSEAWKNLEDDTLYDFVDELYNIQTIDSFEFFLDKVGIFLYEYFGPRMMNILDDIFRDIISASILYKKDAMILQEVIYCSTMDAYLNNILEDIESKAKELGLAV